MAERVSGLIAVLEDDARESDLEPLITAISMLRGVLEVKPITSRPGLEYTLKLRIKKDVLARVEAALAGGEEGD